MHQYLDGKFFSMYCMLAFQMAPVEEELLQCLQDFHVLVLQEASHPQKAQVWSAVGQHLRQGLLSVFTQHFQPEGPSSEQAKHLPAAG